MVYHRAGPAAVGLSRRQGLGRPQQDDGELLSQPWDVPTDTGSHVRGLVPAPPSSLRLASCTGVATNYGQWPCCTSAIDTHLQGTVSHCLSMQLLVCSGLPAHTQLELLVMASTIHCFMSRQPHQSLTSSSEQAVGQPQVAEHDVQTDQGCCGALVVLAKPKAGSARPRHRAELMVRAGSHAEVLPHPAGAAAGAGQGQPHPPRHW